MNDTLRPRRWSVLSALAFLCTALLSGCSSMLTSENSAPYTPDDVIAMAEEEFAILRPHIVFESAKVEKEAPYQRNIYVLRDDANDFTFSCKAFVRNPTLPLPCAQRDTNVLFAYAHGYATHLNARIRALTAQYNFRTATTEEAEALIQSKAKRKQGDLEFPLFDEGDFIFVGDDAKGADMTAICKGLYDMYRPAGDPALLSTLYGRKITFYYLPPGEEDLTKARFIMFVRLEGRYDWAATLSNNPGSSSSETDPAVMEKNLGHYFGHCLRTAREDAAQRGNSSVQT